jgi:hypothetical protein
MDGSLDEYEKYFLNWEEKEEENLFFMTNDFFLIDLALCLIIICYYNY